MENNRSLTIVIIIAIVITVVTVIFLFLVPDLLIEKDSNENTAEDDLISKEDPEDIVAEENLKEDSTGEEVIDYGIAYLEIGIDLNSRHFGSRVANIYRISPDGTNRELIFTDIEDEYGLAQVYSISPDGRKILFNITDDARGVYSALCYIDMATGNLVKLVEFDFSGGEEVLEAIYKEPIWSQDSSKVAYEVISNPYSSNFRDGGIYIVDLNTFNRQELILDIEGASLRSTTFLYPVLFGYDDSKIFAVFHPYFGKMEEDEIIDFYTVNQSLNILDIGTGEMEEIININQFEGIEAEIISSFENFNIIRDSNLLIFQVLGDFEEDGDIWAYNINGGNLFRLTSDTGLREQQPNISDTKDISKKISAVGVYRYGTIAEHTKSGSILIIDINDLQDVKVKDCTIEGIKPIFSPDGSYITYMFFEYSDDLTFIEKSLIRRYDVQSGEDSTVVSSNNIFELIGWIKD